MSTTKMFAASAAALLAVVPLVRAGSTIVNNNCNQNVYVWANKGWNETSSMMTFAPGTGYRYPYQGEAVCIKIHSQPDPGSDNTELEYSSLPDGSIYYDLSNIVGYPEPFRSSGVALVPSNPGCEAINCPPFGPGVTQCDKAYNHPDDVATKPCSSADDLVLNLCGTNKNPGGQPGSGSGSGSGSSGGSSAAASSPPTSTKSTSTPQQYPSPPVNNAGTGAGKVGLQVGNGGAVVEGGIPNNPNVVYTTTTVIVGRSEATEAPQRRHVHHHAAHDHHH